MMKLSRLCATGALVCLVATTIISGTAYADAKADAAEILQLDKKFGEAIAKKDSEIAVALYAEDTIVLDPGAPARRGRSEMRAIWTEFVKTPGLAIRIIPEKIDVSAAGDLATDFGRFEVELESTQGRSTTVHKYLTIWKKIDGAWRVTYDAWNANAPDEK